MSVLMERADIRYGGRWEARWDGRTFLVEPTSPLTRDPEWQQRIREALARDLDALPEVPSGFEGWYYPEAQDQGVRRG